jgi:beta-glucosidase
MRVVRGGIGRTVTIPLAGRSFEYFSEAAGGWGIAKGCDRIKVGASSRELPLRARVEVPEGPC